LLLSLGLLYFLADAVFHVQLVLHGALTQLIYVHPFSFYYMKIFCAVAVLSFLSASHSSATPLASNPRSNVEFFGGSSLQEEGSGSAIASRLSPKFVQHAASLVMPASGKGGSQKVVVRGPLSPTHDAQRNAHPSTSFGQVSPLPRRRLQAAGYLQFLDNTNLGALPQLAGKQGVSSKNYEGVVFARPTGGLTYILQSLGMYIGGTSNFDLLIDLRGLTTSSGLPGTVLQSVTCSVNATKNGAWQMCGLGNVMNISSAGSFAYYSLVIYTNNAAAADHYFTQSVASSTPTGLLTAANIMTVLLALPDNVGVTVPLDDSEPVEVADNDDVLVGVHVEDTDSLPEALPVALAETLRVPLRDGDAEALGDVVEATDAPTEELGDTLSDALAVPLCVSEGLRVTLGVDVSVAVWLAVQLPLPEADHEAVLVPD
jgi:hypothetical protein